MIKKIASLKGHIDCPFCLSYLEWNDINDIQVFNGNKYIVCPECGKNIHLNEKEDYWDTSGGVLPDISEEDEGKILQVVDGAWSKVESSGGETWVTVFNESVTIEYNEHFNANEAYITTTEPITADTIKVTFDGTEYECQNISPKAGIYMYGGFNTATNNLDFSEYPFCINNVGSIRVLTEQEDTYSLKIEVPESSGGSGSSDFSIANVVIASQVSGTCSALIPVVSEGGKDDPEIYVQPNLAVQANAEIPLEYHIPMYKGLAEIEIHYSEISGVDGVEVFGDIEYNSGNIKPVFLIRGDGHIRLTQPTM